MPGMAITVCLSVKKTVTSRHSLLLGGRYRYKTAPQGYIASGDGYTRRYDEIVAHIKNKTKCIDDTLLWAPTIEDSFSQCSGVAGHMRQKRDHPESRQICVCPR